MSTLDTTQALAILEQAKAELEAVHGAPTPDPTSKTRNSEAAALTRPLLHIDHLLSQAKVEVMSVYWSVKDTSTGRNTA